MPDAWGWEHNGDLVNADTRECHINWMVDRAGGNSVPLRIETARVRYADDLYQVLKDLVGLAKLASSPLNAYHAAVRNADELLKQIESESTEDANHG